jgi:Fur family transcriptional regulator, peroxide stress response regulator
MHILDRQNIHTRIVEAGLKATHQRIVVYETLMDLHGHHPVAEEVYQKLKPFNPSISLGTVYKTLDTFVEKNIISRVLSEEGGKRYDVNISTHNHIYCSNTKEIMDYEDRELEELISNYFKAKSIDNFEMKSFSVHLTGTKPDPEKQIRITTIIK